MNLLRGATMHKTIAGPSAGVPAAFMGGAVLTFDKVEDFQAVMAKHGAALISDIPNFTNAEPLIYIAEVIAQT